MQFYLFSNHNSTYFLTHIVLSNPTYFLTCIQPYYTNFTLEKNRDSRYIPPPLIIPLTHILINECNPEKDIKVDTYSIQTQNDVAHIYKEIRKYLITILIDRLKWLWKQYTQLQSRSHGLISPIQSFETKIVWVYQRYKYRIL